MPVLPLLGSVNEFIDLAMGVVSIMLIWYIIKFFLVAPPTKADKEARASEWANRGEGLRNWVGEKIIKGKEKEKKAKEKAKSDLEKAKREKLLRGAISGVVDSSKHLKRASDELSNKDSSSLDSAKDSLKLIKKTYLPRIYRCLHTAWRIGDTEDKEFFHQLSAYARAMEGNFHTFVEKKLPDNTTDTNWDTKVTHTKSGIVKMEEACTYLFSSLQNYVDKKEKNVPAGVGSPPTGPTMPTS